METVDPPILDKTEIRLLIDTLDYDFYSDSDKELFTEIIYSGFGDPYNYDDIYADFLISYFGSADFAVQSSALIRQERTFRNLFKSRGSDEEYHREVLNWNLDNLELRFYSNDHESLTWCIERVAKRYSITLPELYEKETADQYWKRAKGPIVTQINKEPLGEDFFDGIYLVDIDKSQEIINMVDRINMKWKQAE